MLWFSHVHDCFLLPLWERYLTQGHTLLLLVKMWIPIHRSGVGRDILHFQPAPRECRCCWWETHFKAVSHFWHEPRSYTLGLNPTISYFCKRFPIQIFQWSHFYRIWRRYGMIVEGSKERTKSWKWILYLTPEEFMEEMFTPHSDVST